MKYLPTVLQLTGLVTLTIGVSMFSIALGVITGSVAIIALGVALEIGRSNN
jgi:hypothetical protein